MSFQINYNDTISLIKAMERVQAPASFLIDTFFSNKAPVSQTAYIMLEQRQKKRRLAPFVVKSGKGVNMKRESSTMKVYVPPMVGPRRVLSPEDLTHRSFGETVYSSLSESQRASQIIGDDLRELQDMVINRQNQMAADILLNGRYDIKGYADDGKTELIDTIEFNDWTQRLIPTIHWDQAGAKIYTEISEMSSKIRRNTGQIPTIMVCGKNVPKYIMDNDEIKSWLMIPNRENLAMLSIKPKFESPQIIRVGRIESLNLEIYTYEEVYIDDEGNEKSYIGDDDVIIAIPKLGQQLYGAVTLLGDDMNFKSYSTELVPYYIGDKTAQTLSLTMYSRFLLAPFWSDSWATIKTKGE